MRIDYSAAEQFLSTVDGDAPFAAVWQHPAYELAREHAELLGRDLSIEDVRDALGDKQSTSTPGEAPSERGEQIAQLLADVRSNEDTWIDQTTQALNRITPNEPASDIPIFLAIGYSSGLGLADGAYINLNEPLFLQQPRQLLYTAIHESSHVVYERVHGTAKEVTPDKFHTSSGQRHVFNTVFHTEAYATYTPLALRRRDGNVGNLDHEICEDYSACADETRMEDLVEEFDAVREAIADGSMSRETFLSTLFGKRRLPYRVGCALLERIGETEGMAAVRDGFYLDGDEFIETHEELLDVYRN
ncbi:MAG: hypothetical protein ABEH81_08105 [Halopenitus sp.]